MAALSDRTNRRFFSGELNLPPALRFIGLAALLVVLVLLAYQQIWHAGFIWDDDLHVTRNPTIVGRLGFKGIWTTTAAMYYPLVTTNFWVQHALWGLNPLPYHLVNVAMHATCAILLWQVLLRLEIKGAWLGAAIWTLHPVQVESVAWITELKNTQSCLFYLFSILFFLKWRKRAASPQDRQHNWPDYAVSLLCAVAAILSKTSTVMLPVILGLCWWWRDSDWHWRNITKLIPFLCVSLAAATWTVWEQKFHAGALGTDWTQTWLERLIIAGRAIWFYLGKLIWPHPLIFIYPRWKVDPSRFLQYLPTLAAVGGLIVLWWKRNGPLRPVFFASVYFVASLFPVLDFFDVYFFRYSFVGDHLQYLASMGPLVLLGAAITKGFVLVWSEGRLVFRANRRGSYAVALGAGLSRLPRLVPALIIVMFVVLSWRQVRIYRDSDTLWRDTVTKSPTSWMAQNNYAARLLREGKEEEGLQHYRLALQLDSNQFEIYNNLGFTLLEMGRVRESLPSLEKAAQLRPNSAAVQYNWSNALSQIGLTDEALAHLQRAVEIDPTYVPAYSNMGYILLQKGRPEESLESLEIALRIDPEDVSAHFNIANTLLQLGRPEEALAHLQKALTLAPNDAEAQKNMAWIMATCSDSRIRNGDKAVELAQRANQMTDSRNPIMLITLAAAYAEAGHFPDAVNTAEKALQVANDSGSTSLAEVIRGHIALYRARKPVRDVR